MSSLRRLVGAHRALSIALFASVASFLWTRILVARVEHDFPPSGAFVEVNGTRVHYVERGTGTPIVLMHGAYGGVEDWRASIFDAVAQRGRAIAIDRPGHGYTDRDGEEIRTPSGQARFVHAVLARLGIERAVIVGFSWSGAMAASYALQFPQETMGVMTVNGALYEWESISASSDALLSLPLIGPVFAHTIGMPFAHFARVGGSEHAFQPAAVSPSYARSSLDLELRPQSLLANAIEMRTLKSALRAQSQHYVKISVPFEIVAGLGDDVTYATFHSFRLHEAVAGSKLVRIEGAGHQAVFSHPIAVLRALDELLADVRAADARR
ncbi:MAG: alpha/beta hydrolase [Planctomycetota bacterium]|nr:alpha/beta hydrolase [Planctomycetota bacterium]